MNDVGRLEIKADQNAERSNSGIQSGTQEPQYQSVSNEGYELLKKYNANGRDPTLLSSKVSYSLSQVFGFTSCSIFSGNH